MSRRTDRIGRRLRASARSADPEVAARLRDGLNEEQPGFRAAVLADTRITAEYRGEHHQFRSRLEAVAQAVRLAWVTDSFGAQVCYRAKVACRTRGVPVAPAILHRLAISLGQISIGDRAVVRPGVYIPHGQVVIDGLTFVDTRVVLRPFVTLGLRDGHIFGPHIAARARIGTGAKVFGPVRIGAHARIGANAVVIRNVPEGRRAVGVPARILPSEVPPPRSPVGR